MLDVKALVVQRAAQQWHYDFNVHRGTTLALMGPSGVGKTTLLECLGGFVTHQSGDIFLDGVAISDLSAEQRPASTLFQQHNLFEHLSVEQNIRLGFQQGHPTTEQWRAVLSACELLGVADLLSRQPGELSGGQRQRVALVRTVLRDQPLILLDEPFSALDDVSRERAGDWVRGQVVSDKKVLVFVTHKQEDAERWADEVLYLQRPTAE